MIKQTSSGGVVWLITLATYATLAGMYYLWQIKGMEQAGNVFMFYVWATAIISTPLMFVDAGAKDYYPRSAVAATILRACAALVLLATIWAGHTAAASLYAIGMLSAYVYGDKAKKAWRR